MNEEEHISFIGRIKNWYSGHRDFFRILQCAVLALIFSAMLAYSVYADAYHGSKERREVDNIHIFWEIPEGKIVAAASRELLTVPVSLKVSARKKHILYKLDNECFRIRKIIQDGNSRIDIKIMPEDVEITNPEYKQYVTVEKVSVREENKLKVVSDEKGVTFPINLDKNITRKLRVRVQHDNNVPDCCWVDEEGITINGSGVNVPQINVTGPSELLNQHYKDGWIDTETVHLDNAVQPFEIKEVRLLVRKDLDYSQDCVDVFIPVREYWKRELYDLPIFAMFSGQKNNVQLKFSSDLPFQSEKPIAGDIKVILRGKKEDLEKLGKTINEIRKNVHLFFKLKDNEFEVSASDLFCSVSVPGVTVLGILQKETGKIKIKCEIKEDELSVQNETTDKNPEMESSKNDSQKQSVQSGNTQGNAWWKWNRPH